MGVLINSNYQGVAACHGVCVGVDYLLVFLHYKPNFCENSMPQLQAIQLDDETTIYLVLGRKV